MTLQEVENTVLNGFHDSRLKRIVIDYERAGVRLDISLSVGDPAGGPEQHDLYRDASISISGLVFLSIQPPASKYVRK
jgi:hypothetical protein